MRKMAQMIADAIRLASAAKTEDMDDNESASARSVNRVSHTSVSVLFFQEGA